LIDELLSVNHPESTRSAVLAPLDKRDVALESEIYMEISSGALFQGDFIAFI
jgi:hypothetical protein